MKCPYCRNDDTKVIDSRLNSEGNEVKRRRHCATCDERFTTYERIDRRYPRVLKSNGSAEAFDENKIRRGIMRSLEKRNVESRLIENAIDRICDALSRKIGDEIDSSVVGETILRELGQIDDVAYIRFASVYRQFNNLNDFTEALKKLKKQTKR